MTLASVESGLKGTRMEAEKTEVIGVSWLMLGQRRASPGSPSVLLPEGPAGGRGSEAWGGPAWVVSCPAPTRGAVA